MNPETHTCDCGYTWRHGQSGAHSCGQYYRQTIAELRAAAAPQVVADERAAYPGHILETATELARCIYRDNYKNEAPGWEPLPDLAGVLSQIDNMVCGMRRAAPVQAQGPVAWRYEWASCITGDGPQNFKLTFDVEPPPEWAVQDGQARNVVKLFGAPVQPVAVPDGWKLVPVEPTDAMNAASEDVPVDTRYEGGEYYTCGDGIYKAMLAAAPAAPAAQRDAKFLLLESIEEDGALWRVGINAFRLALNEMTGSDSYVVKKTYEAMRAAIAAKAANK